ncbi:hypothetical protein OEZ86_009677 [Tetradesmus obliquus]|uniref:Uncharacterized protein n=1 Tax=Tetradesmus obliquus TaxID=3088 RepID=A0ABY8UNL9_TETOB|nr:hypothetical protein OEZ85_001121 [Tetradesmus obliquus]WIA43165.1 hypothetical protein OEZ86_009677 [Tetradesmus obliquus]
MVRQAAQGRRLLLIEDIQLVEIRQRRCCERAAIKSERESHKYLRLEDKCNRGSGSWTWLAALHLHTAQSSAS